MLTRSTSASAGTDGTEDTLSIATGEDLLGTDGANFEGKPSYSITIVAISTGTADADCGYYPRGKRFATLGVTIKVVDREDVGKVTFPTVREPQEGKSVLAKLTDEDGGETGVKWEWARSVLVDTDDDAEGVQLGCAAAGADSWQDIPNANSASYTPGSDTFDDNNDAIEGGAVNADRYPRSPVLPACDGDVHGRPRLGPGRRFDRGPVGRDGSRCNGASGAGGQCCERGTGV